MEPMRFCIRWIILIFINVAVVGWLINKVSDTLEKSDFGGARSNFIMLAYIVILAGLSVLVHFSVITHKVIPLLYGLLF